VNEKRSNILMQDQDSLWINLSINIFLGAQNNRIKGIEFFYKSKLTCAF